MSESSEVSFASGLPRCVHCGVVIGVYEPLVAILDDGVALETSRAAEPHLVLTARESIYHSDCYRPRNLG